MRDQLENMKIRQRLARCFCHFFHETDPALGIDERQFLISPARRAHDEIRVPGRGRRVIKVLHHEESESSDQFVELW
jgi:hypothetical protein